MAKHRIRVTVNGTAREAEVEPRLLLVHLLRESSGSPAPTSAATPRTAGPARSCWTARR